jgi:hypothetical protein
MALTFADTQTILRSRLSEPTADAWTDAELQDYTYLAELKVLSLLPADAFWDIQEVEEETEGDKAHGYVALPGTAPMQQIVNIEVTPSNATNYKRVQVIEPGRTSEYASGENNIVGWFEDGKFYFTPDIDADVTQTVKFRYVPTATEGAKIVPDRYTELVVSWAYALAIERESAQLASVEKNEFFQTIAMVQQQTYGINKLNRGR